LPPGLTDEGKITNKKKHLNIEIKRNAKRLTEEKENAF
jgi:hypothetical protein